MTTDIIAKFYRNLRAEERFRVIYAASGRGDETERARLRDAGPLMTLSVADHWPHSQAFSELSTRVFMELSELAARFSEHRHDLSLEDVGEENADEEKDASHNPPKRHQKFDLVLADGWWLKTNAAGWMLFCDKLSVPPLLAWEGLPGYERLRSALADAETLSFDYGEMMKWLNSTGIPETTEIPVFTQLLAESHEQFYRARVERWRK